MDCALFSWYLLGKNNNVLFPYFMILHLLSRLYTFVLIMAVASDQIIDKYVTLDMHFCSHVWGQQDFIYLFERN